MFRHPVEGRAGAMARSGADGAEPPEAGPQPDEVRGVAVRMSFAGAEGSVMRLGVRA